MEKTGKRPKRKPQSAERRGDAASMRKVLEQIAEVPLPLWTQRVSVIGDVPNFSTFEERYEYEVEGLLHRTLRDIVEMARVALTAPARNCDVMSPAEMKEAYIKFCGLQKPRNGGWIPCDNCILGGTKNCMFLWATMPYEKGGAQ